MARKKMRANGDGTIYKTIRNGKPYYTAQATIMLDGEPQRKSKSSYKRSIVKDWLDKVAEEMDLYVEPISTMPLCTYLEYWLYNVKQQSLKPNTFSRYESIVRLHVNTYSIANEPIKELKLKEMQRYFTRMAAEKPLPTVKYALSIVKSALEYAYNNEYIKRNPAKGVELPKETQTKVETFTEEEQTQILSLLSTDAVDLGILLAYSSGLRLGELLALQWSDWNGLELTVDKQYVRNRYVTQEKTYYKNEIQSTKTTASNRTVPLPLGVCDYLNAIAGQGFILSEDDGETPLERKRLPRRLKKILKELHLPHRKFHAIRHAYATRLFERGVAPKTVQTLMGHAEIKTTLDIYTHVMRTTQDQAIAKINNLYKPTANLLQTSRSKKPATVGK